MGVARALQMPAQQAIVPALVGVDELPRAFAASSTLLKIAVIGGPVLGGFLYAFGAAVVYGVVPRVPRRFDRVHRGDPARPHARARRARCRVESLFAGFAFIWRKKQVLGAISLDLFAVLLGGATALLPIYAKDILATGPWGLGLLRAAPAVGALAMGLRARAAAARASRRAAHVRVAWRSTARRSSCSASRATSCVSMVALAIGGGADMVSVVVRQTLVQLDTPDDMRGRVSAVNGVFIGASNELGEFRAGSMAAIIGPIGATIVGGVGTLIVAALWIRWFPALARRDRLLDRGT